MCSSHGVFACTFGGFCAILQKAARLSHTVLLLQFIPARGRKPQAPRHDLRHSLVATYPREGTETNICGDCQGTRWLQLIPARGRKPITRSRIRSPAPAATYPREGTETALVKRICYNSPELQLIPARGRKRSRNRRGRKRGSCCNLSPRGDGNASRAFCRSIRVLQLIPARGRKLDLSITF